MAEDTNFDPEIDNSIASYTEQVTELETKITNNLRTILNYSESLKSSSPVLYSNLIKEYEEINNTFLSAISEAREAQGNPQAFDKNYCVANLETVLKYTDITIQKNQMPSHEDETLPENAGTGIPEGASATSTAMVVPSSQTGTQVEMENVGAVRAWWSNLQPGTQNLLKALAIGGMIFGGKMLFDYTKKKMAEGERVSNPKRRRKKIEEDYDNDDDDNDDEEEYEELEE